MTTDPFTDAARAEAERQVPPFEHDEIPPRDLTTWSRTAFRVGAEWARDHLAAQEPTDAEVEAAAGAMYRNPEGWALMLALYRSLVSEGNPRAKGHVVEHRLDLAREGLLAARAVRAARRDEEGDQ